MSANQNETDNFSLAQLPMQKTLRESEFYFPMENANVKALEKLLTDHRNANKINNTTSVRLPSYKTLKGMMHGFIDLVFEQNGKYYVCDYKSSHLGDNFSDYNQTALQENVEKNYYDLQYLIYSVALHRHLKQNLPDYDIQQHFGGIYYLYLRGMKRGMSRDMKDGMIPEITNDEHNYGTGVYHRRITSTELTQLDDLFLGDNSTKEQA